MKLAKVLLLMAGLCVFTVFLVLNAYVLIDRPLFPIATESLEYSFFVDDQLGFDIATDKLRLGAVRPGSLSRRTVEVYHPFASHVDVRVRGEGSRFLYPEFETYALVNGSAEVLFIVSPLDGAEHKEYAGKVFFYFT